MSFYEDVEQAKRATLFRNSLSEEERIRYAMLSHQTPEDTLIALVIESIELRRRVEALENLGG